MPAVLLFIAMHCTLNVNSFILRLIIPTTIRGILTKGFHNNFIGRRLIHLLIFLTSLFLTAADYIDILEEVLLPTVRAMALPAPEPIYLVQDNSPVHTAGVVNQWFAGHPEFIRLFWPARSPDFNPIEHLWAFMVNEWVEGAERTPRQLIRHCRAVWESLRRNQGLCENLVRSMPQRLQDCVEAGGEYTRY